MDFKANLMVFGKAKTVLYGVSNFNLHVHVYEKLGVENWQLIMLHRQIYEVQRN